MGDQCGCRNLPDAYEYGTTGITPDTALRLARVFNTTPAYWVNLQTNYDMAVAAKEIDVSNIEPLVAA
ncbi:MAG: hypothetical protein ABJD13_10590 [Paracoccaceae bacterium]